MKEARIIGTLQPVMQNHRLVVGNQCGSSGPRRSAPIRRTVGRFSYLEYSGLYQLTHMANQRGALRKDDRIDVLSNAVNYWLDYMALDSSKAESTSWDS
jgi:hypothetical protein